MIALFDRIASEPPLKLSLIHIYWGMEYLDAVISLKVVSGIEEAISHINRYNTCLLYTSRGV